MNITNIDSTQELPGTDLRASGTSSNSRTDRNGKGTDQHPESRTVFRRALIVLIYFGFFCVLVPAIMFLTGWQLDRITRSTALDSQLLNGISIVLAFAGISIMVVSMGQLWFQGKGLPISHLPPENLVTTGTYRFCRHPIYVGFSAAYLGLALQFISPISAIATFLLLNASWIAYTLLLEEPMLTDRIGTAYRRYCREVPLLPLFPEKIVSRITRFGLAWITMRLNVLVQHPVLFRAGKVVFVTYGLICGIGALVYALWIESVLLQDPEIDPYTVHTYVLALALLTPTGAWLFWWLGHARELIYSRWFGLGKIGFVSYGGLAGMAVPVLLIAQMTDVSSLQLTDAMIPALFLMYAIGRTGCVSYGCCWGKETSERWGFIYDNPDSKMIRQGDIRRIRRHPVQVYGVLHGLIGFAVLVLIIIAAPYEGVATVAGIFLIGYGRLFTEHWRDRPRPFFNRFTAGQLGGLLTLLLGWVGLFLLPPAASVVAAPLPGTSFLTDNPESIPVALLSGLMVTFVYGFNWKEIGTWTGR